MIGRITRAAVALLVTSSSVLAAPAGPDQDAAKSKKKEQPKARVTVFLLPAKGFPDRVVARVANRLQTTLKDNKRLIIKDWSKLLVEFSGETPLDAIRQANDLKEEGIKLLEESDSTTAIEKLQQSFGQLEGLLAHTKKRDLASVQLALGVALARANNRRAALGTFTALLVWRPMMRFDVQKFGTDLVPLFERARAAVKRRRRGSIELKTDPPGARAFLDGRFIGVTPTVAWGLKVGAHYATFKKGGFIKAAQRVEANARMQATYTKELKRSEKFLLLQQTLKQISEQLGKANATSAMLDLRSVLFVDQVVFATMGYHSAGQLKIDAYLYDLRSKIRLSHASVVVPEKKLAKLSELARVLYTNVRYDGTIEAPPEPPPPPPEKRRPFYLTWWFWSAVAVGATAITMTAVFWPSDDSCQGNAPGLVRCGSLSN